MGDASMMYQAALRRVVTARPNKAKPIRANVPGSGTLATGAVHATSTDPEDPVALTFTPLTYSGKIPELRLSKASRKLVSTASPTNGMPLNKKCQSVTLPVKRIAVDDRFPEISPGLSKTNAIH